MVIPCYPSESTQRVKSEEICHLRFPEETMESRSLTENTETPKPLCHVELRQDVLYDLQWTW